VRALSLIFHGGKPDMVIQSYSVDSSSQRAFLSVQSSGSSAAQNLNSAHSSYIPEQEEGKTAVTSQVANKQNQNGQGQNQNGQGQNGNGQGQNVSNPGQTGNGQGQNVNNQANTGKGQANNVNNQGQTANGQGQNVDNQGPPKDEIFKDALTKAKNDRDETLNRMAVRTSSSSSTHLTVNNGYKTPTNPRELRTLLMQFFYEMLTGKNPKYKHQPQKVENLNEMHGPGMFNFFGIFGTAPAERLQPAVNRSAELFHYEYEAVSYQAQGIVKTADGRTIEINVSMQMTREFASYMNISSNASMPVDPIVINYGGTAASLSGEKFLFDLTMNGDLDSLAVLGEGSGFLAVDWNGDGIINDGSELFGPSTGCGFTELRKYDSDGNGWIDANDEIFDKLVIWNRDKDGNDTVYTLKELGIGAIFLGDIATEFSFKDERNDTLGVMRSTSFFIKNCGGAGTLSHIDLML